MRNNSQAGGVVDDEARTAPDGALQPNVHITVECQEQELRGKGEYLVPVMIQIPIGELVLQPAAESHVAQISVASVVRDEQSSIESTEFVDVEVGNVTGETGR